MIADPNREKLLKIIEEHGRIGERFCTIRRLGLEGGRGAFSLLFEAEDEHHKNNKVALKFLHPFEREPYRLECFDRECTVLSRLIGQRDIIQLVAPRSEFKYTFQPHGFEIPFPYFALELAKTDLGTLIETNAIDAHAALVYFRAMCRSVQRIHAQRIAHRDIKPPNFLVLNDDAIKLSDFGTARLLDGSTPGILADYAQFPPGDLGYVAPEMLASLHDDDPNIALGADIFSLGSCLFEMYSGVPLGVQLFDRSFQADLMQAMGAVRRGERIRTYDQFVPNMAASHPLPSLAGFAPDMPRSIVYQVDDLYRSMAALDYRYRLKDFDHVFLKVNRALLTLENQDKIRLWRERRDKEHAAALEKRRRILHAVERRSST
jgi:serine/threonine protein kinase